MIKRILLALTAVIALMAANSWADDKPAAMKAPAAGSTAPASKKWSNPSMAAIQAAIDLDSAGNTTAAIAAFDKIGVLKSKNLEAWRLNDEASTYMKAGDNAKATELLEKATETNDQNYVAWNNLGSAYEASKDLDKAKDAYQKSIDAAKAANASSAKAQGNLDALQARLDKMGKGKKSDDKPDADDKADNAKDKK
jgi:tetratricopeptide (TPR) repeat protein